MPLSALRFYVIGEEAAERAATEAETAEMVRLYREALSAGAAGFSMSLAPQHIGFQGRPLASRMARTKSCARFAARCASWVAALSRFFPNRGSTSVPNDGGFDLLTMLASESMRPVTWLALLDLPGTPRRPIRKRSSGSLRCSKRAQDSAAGHAASDSAV